MIDIGNDNLDNELNIQKFRNGQVIDLRTKEEINYEKKIFMNEKYNPSFLEYWRNIFPTKTDNELDEYRVKWSKENPKYLKFKNL